MKKLIVLSLFVLVVNDQSYSQAIDIKNDTTIYQYLLKKLSVGNMGINDTIPVFYKTSLSTFKTSNFQKMPLDRWKSVDSRKDVVKEMKDFLDKIDINNLNEYELTVKLGKHPFKNIEQRTYNETIAHPQPILIFSPIIYSSDKQLALCSVYQYFEIMNASEDIYLLMFKNGKWELVRILGVGMS